MDEFPISIGKRKRNRAAGIAVNLILLLLVVIVVAELLFFSRFRRYYVRGDSMYPTLTGADVVDDVLLPGGDYVYADIFATPERGDIVVIDALNMTTGEKKTIIKRVVAFGGETVELRRGELYIDDRRVAEPYLDGRYNSPDAPANTHGPVTVDEGCIFVLGDNRDESNDSRGDYRVIPADGIVGVVPQWSLDARWLTTPVSTFFDFTLPSAFSGCGN